MIFKNT